MSERPQRGLGRGLAALLGDAPAADAPAVAALDAAEVAQLAAGAREIPIELIARNPDQPRKVFTEAEIDELAASIREKGVLQPVLVRPAPGGEGWQLVAGERRWRAAQKAGLKAIPALVRELDDLEVLEIGIVENVQRADLNAIEEAMAYKALQDRFARTQDAIAQVVGKSRSHVANTLRLLNLPDAVQDHVLFGRLSAGHARAIATAADPGGLAERVIAGGLSVRQAEKLAREASQPAKPRLGKTPGAADGSARADIGVFERDLAEELGMRVVLKDRGDAGELTIHYDSLEQLDELCRRMMRG
jgi:ParB family chromosome partitioning protein